MPENTKDGEVVTSEEVIETYEVELAGLSDGERDQVIDALREAEAVGELGVTDVDDVILDAQITDDNREDAEEAQREQAEAAEDGDYEKANDRAEEVQDNLADAEAHGGQFAEARQEADHDVLVLSEAEWQQDIADENVVEAEGFAEEGMDASADEAADDAEDAQDSADDYGEEGDQDGVYGDHSIYSDGS